MSQNETPMYLVPGRLSKSESTPMFVVEAYDFLIKHIGTPIQPCADVENAGYLCEFLSGLIGFTENPETAARRERKGSQVVALVTRADMEAQVARVEAEKDVEIARLCEVLKELKNISLAMQGHIEPGAPVIDFALAIERTKHVLSKIPLALNEGAAG